MSESREDLSSHECLMCAVCDLLLLRAVSARLGPIDGPTNIFITVSRGAGVDA